MALTIGQVAQALRELITALDKRSPRVERTGEAGIARESAALREEAVSRLAEIDDSAGQRSPADPLS